MKLFSEKVQPTLTNSTHNILQVENYEEVFFDVYDIEINKTKYPVQKVSEHNGNPVVSVPVTVKGVKSYYPFVLSKGKFEVLFNENNTDEKLNEEPLLIDEQVISEKIEYPQNVDDDIPYVEILEKNKEILEQIEKAKKEAEKYALKIKKQKLQEANKEIAEKKKALGRMLYDARSSLVNEFVSISDKIKKEFIDENDNRFDEIKITIDNKINDLSDSLSISLKEDFNTSSIQLESKIQELVSEIHKTIEPKIDNELKNIATEIVEKVDSIEKSLDDKLSNKADITLIENVEGELNSVAKANIELNDKINKGVNKALSRVGNIDKKVDEITIALSEEVEDKISKAEENITKYYTEKLKVLEEKTFDITEETRKYIVSLVQESKEHLLSEVRKLKDEKPIQYIVESKGKKQSINQDDLVKDFDRKINSKIDNEVTRLRKYIAVYSGGGSVAQQFADGGTMNGDLIINGNVSVKTLSLDTTIDPPPYKEGTLYYNNQQHTLSLYTDIPGSSLELGKELWTRVVNKTDSPLLDGSVVYLSGAQGSRPKAWLAKADSKLTADTTIGIVTYDIPVNSEGNITTFGEVRGINLSPYNDGDVLWLSPSVPGGLTNIQPHPPDHSIRIGHVVRNQHDGILLVDIDTGSEISDAHDVKITNPQNGQTLIYNSVSGLWENGTGSGGASSEYAWNYDSSEVMSDPGTGDVRSNASVATNVTELAVSRYDSNGIDTLFTLAGLSVGDLIFAQEKGDADNWSRFSVRNAPTNNGSWFFIPVTFIENGGSPATKNTDILAKFTYGGASSNTGNDYLPLSGGTIIGDLTTTGLLSSASIETTSLISDTATIPTIAGNTSFSNNVETVGQLTAIGQPALASLGANHVLTTALGDLRYGREQTLTSLSSLTVSNTTPTDIPNLGPFEVAGSSLYKLEVINGFTTVDSSFVFDFLLYNGATIPNVAQNVSVNSFGVFNQTTRVSTYTQNNTRIEFFSTGPTTLTDHMSYCYLIFRTAAGNGNGKLRIRQWNTNVTNGTTILAGAIAKLTKLA